MSVDFDGTGDYVSLPANGVAGIDVAVRTIAAWVKVDTAGDNLIVYLAATALGAGAFIEHINIEEVNAGTFRFDYAHLWSGGTARWRTPTDLNTGQWYHVAVTYDRGSTANDPAIFVDGSQVVESEVGAPSGTVTTGQDSVRIGTNAPGTGNYFNGKIAECAHWDVALSDAEIASLARGSNPQRIRRGNGKVYMPLYHAAYGSDYAQGLLGTFAGNPTTADHPPVMPPFGFDLGWHGAFTAGGAFDLFPDRWMPGMNQPYPARKDVVSY